MLDTNGILQAIVSGGYEGLSTFFDFYWVPDLSEVIANVTLPLLDAADVLSQEHYDLEQGLDDIYDVNSITKSKVVNLENTVSQGFATVQTGITDTLSELGDLIWSILQNLPSLIADAASSIWQTMQGAFDLISSSYKTLLDQFNFALSSLSAFIGSLISGVYNSMLSYIDNIIQEMKIVLEEIYGDFSVSIIDTFWDVYEKTSELIGEIDVIPDSILWPIEQVIDLLDNVSEDSVMRWFLNVMGGNGTWFSNLLRNVPGEQL